MEKTIGDVTIPALGLGTWKMEGAECTEAVKRALEMGYRHVDTARMYRNEAAVGRGIAEADVPREDVFLTTKVWRTDLERDAVHAAVETSLDELDVDHVDLLLVHWPNEDVPLQETLEAFREVQEAGKTRHIGVSNFTVPLLEEAMDIADIVCNQVEMHPFHPQEEMQRFCAENDLFLTAYSPLGRGEVLDHDVIRDIAHDRGVTPAQVALRWLIQQDNVLAIPKAIPEDYQRDNRGALDFALDRDEMQRISGIEEERKFVYPDFAPW